MPLLPLTDPLPTNPEAPANEEPPQLPHREESLVCEWAGEFSGVEAAGLTLGAGWDGATIRLLHAQRYRNGETTPYEIVDLIAADREAREDDSEGPYDMAKLERKHWGPLPADCGMVTVQYVCPSGSLHALFEYKTS